MTDERKAVKYHSALVNALLLAVETIDEFDDNGITRLSEEGRMHQEGRKALLAAIEADKP